MCIISFMICRQSSNYSRVMASAFRCYALYQTCAYGSCKNLTRNQLLGSSNKWQGTRPTPYLDLKQLMKSEVYNKRNTESALIYRTKSSAKVEYDKTRLLLPRCSVLLKLWRIYCGINLSTFRRKVLHLSSGQNAYPDDGGNEFLRNFGKFVPVYTALHPSRAVFFIVTPVRTLILTYC